METEPFTAVFMLRTVDESVLDSQFRRLQREFGPCAIEIDVDRPHGMSVAVMVFPVTPEGERKYEAMRRMLFKRNPKAALFDGRRGSR